MAIEKKQWNLSTPFLSGQPLIETWAAHGQPYPFWISESLQSLPAFFLTSKNTKRKTHDEMILIDMISTSGIHC
jgi:hypothetical protein